MRRNNKPGTKWQRNKTISEVIFKEINENRVVCLEINIR